MSDTKNKLDEIIDELLFDMTTKEPNVIGKAIQHIQELIEAEVRDELQQTINAGLPYAKIRLDELNAKKDTE